MRNDGDPSDHLDISNNNITMTTKRIASYVHPHYQSFHYERKGGNEDIIFSNNTLIYAIPCFPSGDPRPKNIHLPCRVLGHRFQNGKLQYKLCFFDRVLDKNRMRKQWRDKKRILLKDTNISATMNELDRCGDVYEKELAMKVGVGDGVIIGVMEKMNPDKPCNNCSLEESTVSGTYEHYVYCYAISPISVTMP